MKITNVKSRNRFGVIENNEMVDIDGIITITAELWREQPDNPMCIEFFAWIKTLGHKPSGEEFEQWVTERGMQLKKLDAIEDRN